MKRLFILLALVLLTMVPAFAAEVWVRTQGFETGLDEQDYITGFGVSTLNGKATAGAEAAARSQALSALAQRLKVSIDGSSRLTDSQFGKENYSSFQSDIKATVAIDLSGVKDVRTAFDPARDCWVALAVLDKAQMIRALEDRRQSRIADLEADLAEVKALAERKRIDLLQKALQTFDVHLMALVDDVALSRLLGGGDGAPILAPYYQAKTSYRATLVQKALLTRSDAVNTVFGDLNLAGVTGKTIAVVPPVYKTSDIAGPWSGAFRNELADSIALKVPRLAVTRFLPDQKPDLVVKGSYFEVGTGWHFTLKLSEVTTGRLLASSEFDLDEAFVRAERLAFVPENLKQTIVDREVQAAIYDNPAPVELKAWTNKGSDGLVFEEGEHVDFTVQASRPGFVSVLYTLAGPDHLRVPLLLNHPIFAKDIDRPVSLPRQGPFQAPFGTETATFFFSTAKMPEWPTVTTTVDGQLYPVLAEDYSKFVVRTRGIGGLPALSSATEPVLKTDTTLSLNVIRKLSKR